MKKVLEENADNILQPSEFDTISTSVPKLKEKFGYLVKQYYLKGEVDIEREYYVLYKTENSTHYFRHFNDKRQPTGVEMKLDNKVMFLKLTENGNFDSYMSHFNECEFVIGKCQYETYSGKTEIETVFDNGVWITKFNGVGLRKKTMKRIYDKNGILIFRSIHGYIMGKETYSERIAFEPEAIEL
ncbi:hypothetical protein NI389_03555 [Pseudoalteromonas xiamenensis]|uniref:hypothetical protein n=1 Tax=Pseudoalteromonas xiamenensis TaxID=882626 RepID=UPI0027E4921F|nr:hypothetical protein [Pseudoalteromonas xiamenensis]WMN60495.1 hypothetical protein NI389_03555 [Pseudoalteromonas xiamenensis]